MIAVKPGSRLLVDFVNTLDRESGVDALADARGLAGWLRARGLLHRRPDEAAAAEARELREALRALMHANNGGEDDREVATAVLDTAARREGVVIRFEDGGVRLVAAAGGVGAILAAAGEAMVDGSWQRLKACRAESCRWAFLDNARNRSRQWCSMSVCGNREKARTFRRKRATRA